MNREGLRESRGHLFFLKDLFTRILWLNILIWLFLSLFKINNRNPETFWTTTGMFPQEFIICFHKHVRIERLVIQSYFGKQIIC